MKDLISDTKPTPYTLATSEHRYAKPPHTFLIPTREERMTVQVGHYARLIFLLLPEDREGRIDAESMWVEVTSATDGVYKGTLANDSVYIPIEDGDEVEFNHTHVISILAM